MLDHITVVVDASGSTATLTDPGDPAWKCDLRIERPDRDSLHLDGHINGIESSVMLHRLPLDTMRLVRDRAR